jgi:nucleotide-binding universal stress UspA family protein
VNFSKECRRMLPCVTWVADQLKANLTLLHVVQSRAGRVEEDVAAQVQSELVEFLPPDRSQGQVRYRVLAGPSVGEAIVEYANAQDADLIMMPTRGQGIFRRSVVGSTTETVLRTSEAAVWTEVRPGEPRTGLPRVLCALRLDDDDSVTVTYANEVAQSLGARLVVSYAVPEINEGLLAQMVDRRDVLNLEEAWRRIRELLSASRVDAEIIVAVGSAETVLRQAVLRSRARLVVAARGEDPSAYDIVRASLCPVLIRPTTQAISSRIFRAEDDRTVRARLSRAG